MNFLTKTREKNLNSNYTDNDYIINVIRNFEAAYDISIDNGSNITVEMDGFDVTVGESFTNNGIDPPLYFYRDKDKIEIDLIILQDNTIYPIEIKKGIGKDNADKNFSILDQYKMPVATGLIIDTGDSILPLNRNAYYCPVGMIGL